MQKCYPDVYSSSGERGIKLKSKFLLKLKNWKDKKERKATGKNQVEYEKRDEINEFEQKPIDENNEEDEKMLVEEAEKRGSDYFKN